MHQATLASAIAIASITSKIGRGLQLLAVAGAWNQHAEQPRLVQRGQHIGGNFPLLLDPIGRALN